MLKVKLLAIAFLSFEHEGEVYALDRDQVTEVPDCEHVQSLIGQGLMEVQAESAEPAAPAGNAAPAAPAKPAKPAEKTPANPETPQA